MSLTTTLPTAAAETIKAASEALKASAKGLEEVGRRMDALLLSLATASEPAKERSESLVFASASLHRAPPAPVGPTHGAWCSVDAIDYTDRPHTTLARLVEALKALAPETRVAPGSEVTARMLGVHMSHHVKAYALDARNAGDDVWGVARQGRVDTVGHGWGHFNAIEIGGLATTAGRLAKGLEVYAVAAPDAIVTTKSGMAGLCSAPGGPASIFTACPFPYFTGCAVDPFGGNERSTHERLCAIARHAQGMVRERSDLPNVATYLGRALAQGGLAAVNLYFVPRAKTPDEAASNPRGDLLTLAEFKNAHGARISSKSVGRLYAAVEPSDLSKPVSLLARVFSTDCDDISSLYGLLDARTDLT